jgi:twinkle protein
MREMEAAALHHDCHAFVLDPWNEVFHDFGKMSETQYIERTLMQLKRKARRLNMTLFIVAHPKKLDDGAPATLYSINGSAAWRNKCDHGVVLRRPSPSSAHVEIEVEKSKDHDTMGKPGKTWIEFNKNICDYHLFDMAAYKEKLEAKALAEAASKKAASKARSGKDKAADPDDGENRPFAT